MTEHDLQNILRISEDECYNLLDTNEIKSFTICNSRRILKASLISYIEAHFDCSAENSMLSYTKADAPPVNLDNHIDYPDCMPPTKGDDGVAYKINRAVMIDGKKQWIHANTEQEYADKLTRLIGRNPDQTEKHNFKKYALDWFNVYSKPNIASVTAESYKRNLNLYILPAFGTRP